MHCSRGLFRRTLVVSVLSTIAFSQTSGNAKKAASDQPRTVKVGVAMMSNRSLRTVSPTWERDQLVQDLRRLQTTRKSNVVIEVVPLDATSREDAGAEAASKDCKYFVLTTLSDLGQTPGGISVGPDGIQPAPLGIGNANLLRRVTVNFAVVEVGAFRSLAEGSTDAPDNDHNDSAAADEAMRVTALRVASEIRKDRPPNID